MMNIDAITLDHWRDLSARVGGNLFKDKLKLRALRKVDRSFGTGVSWERFCDLVVAELEGKMIVVPTGTGKGLPKGGLPSSRSEEGGPDVCE